MQIEESPLLTSFVTKTLFCIFFPVLFMYPEYAETDFIEEFCDDQIFEDHLVSFFVIFFK